MFLHCPHAFYRFLEIRSRDREVALTEEGYQQSVVSKRREKSAEISEQKPQEKTSRRKGGLPLNPAYQEQAESGFGELSYRETIGCLSVL